MKTRVTRDQRARRAFSVAALHDGVAHRADLRAAGLTRHDVASEVTAGRWRLAGRHTVVIGTGGLLGEAVLWRAVWESGSGAVLDGAAALLACGLTGFRPEAIDVALPARNRGRAVPGVRLRRRRDLGPCLSVGVPRVRPEVAVVHAAQWARSDRQAALVICLVVQQRLLPPDRLLTHWLTITRSPRRSFIHAVIRDVCDGAHSLGELDFARLCRARGLPAPTRQAVRIQQDGRATWMLPGTTSVSSSRSTEVTTSWRSTRLTTRCARTRSCSVLRGSYASRSSACALIPMRSWTR